MKKRHKLMVTLSAVAACLAMFTGLALAASQMTRPRPDVVLPNEGGARGTKVVATENDAIDVQTTPESTDEEDIEDATLPDTTTELTPMPTPEPTPTPEITPEPTPTPEITPEPTPLPEGTDTLSIVYTQPQSNYYHSVQDCSGMVGAIEWTEASAISVGKQPCPVCITGEIPAANTPEPKSDDPYVAPVYYTAEGVYYHGNDQCSGMIDAQEHTVAEAEADGKLRCPTCQPVEPDHYDLFLSAFGQGLEALMPGYAYGYSSTADDFFGGDTSHTWYITNGEEVRAACQATGYFKADGNNTRIERAIGTELEDVLCICFYSDNLEDLWPFLAETEVGAIALADQDEALEHMIEKLHIDEPLGMEEGNVWVAIGADGVIQELEVYYVDVSHDVTVTLAWTLTDGEYVHSATVE